MSLRKTYSASSLDVYKQHIAGYFEERGFSFTEQREYNISPKTIDILANTIYARRNELQRILTELVLEASSDKMLVDYNYSIEWVVSSNSASQVAQPFMILELLLKVNEDERGQEYSGKTLQRVILELDKEETREFQNRLMAISKEISSLSD